MRYSRYEPGFRKKNPRYIRTLDDKSKMIEVEKYDVDYICSICGHQADEGEVVNVMGKRTLCRNCDTNLCLLRGIKRLRKNPPEEKKKGSFGFLVVFVIAVLNQIATNRVASNLNQIIDKQIGTEPNAPPVKVPPAVSIKTK